MKIFWIPSSDCIPVCLIPLDPEPDWGIVETKSAQAGAYGYRFYPDKLSGEGFYISVLQKKQSAATMRSYQDEIKNLHDWIRRMKNR